MFKKTLLLATALSVGAFSQAHAQDNTMTSPPTSYQPYYAQQPVTPPTTTTTSSATPVQYGSASSPFAPISDRIVTDPLYLPLKGQIYGMTGYTYGTQHYSTYNAAGTKTSTNSTGINTATQTLAYGISDEFSIHLLDNYQINDNTSTSSRTGTSFDSDNNGLADPTLGATWRVIDQARHNPVDLDLSINYTPDMFTSSTATSGASAFGQHDGSIAAGRQSADFVAGIGHETKVFSILGSATASYLGKRDYSSSGTANQYTQPDGFNYQVGADTQTRFTDRLSLNVGLNYNIVNNMGSTDTTTGVGSTIQGANYLSVPVALNYHFVPNRVVGSLIYNHLDYENGGTDFVNTPASSTSTEHHYENVFGVRLAYVFN